MPSRVPVLLRIMHRDHLVIELKGKDHIRMTILLPAHRKRYRYRLFFRAADHHRLFLRIFRIHRHPVNIHRRDHHIPGSCHRSCHRLSRHIHDHLTEELRMVRFRCSKLDGNDLCIHIRHRKCRSVGEGMYPDLPCLDLSQKP